MCSGLLNLPFPGWKRNCTTQGSVQETETAPDMLSRKGFNATGKLVLTESLEVVFVS